MSTHTYREGRDGDEIKQDSGPPTQTPFLKRFLIKTENKIQIKTF
jgi:hypothetical protein